MNITVATRDVPRAIMGLREFRVQDVKVENRDDGLSELTWDPAAPYKTTGIPKPGQLRIEFRSCENCATLIPRGRRRLARFCCRKCLREHQNKMRARLRLERRGKRAESCAYCGKPMTEDARINKLFCNQTCKQAARHVARQNARRNGMA